VKTTRKPVTKASAAGRAAASMKKKPPVKAAAARSVPAKKPAPAARPSPAAKTKAAPPRPKSEPRTRDRKAAAEDAQRNRTRSVAEAASTHKADSKGYVFINGRRVRMISTKGVAPSKKGRTAATSQQSEDEARAAIRNVKTKLNKRELDAYRDLLVAERTKVINDLSAMEAEALRSSGGNLSHMPIHMADIGTDTFDQDFMLGMAENERVKVREIDAALQRIEDRTYGVCQLTGAPIPKSRLNAKPWAKYTVEAARQIEGGLRS
jgi:RNA polymerase-binding transcription factor DksA